eukprot:3121756-Pyramimonas_sp.AAC.1
MGGCVNNDGTVTSMKDPMPDANLRTTKYDPLVRNNELKNATLRVDQGAGTLQVRGVSANHGTLAAELLGAAFSAEDGVM